MQFIQNNINMKNLPFACIVLLCLLFVVTPLYSTPSLGIDVLQQESFQILKGKRIGLVTHPAGVNNKAIPTVSILSSAPGVKLVALYGPEHGVYGDELAGKKVDNATDPKTGLPVYSLYGKTRKPSPEMLAGIDALVVDLQDIGSRSYTYISTLALAMEACAEQGKEVIVLDRPNPLGGLRVEGPMLNPKFVSFVSQIPVSYVHGMTMGEIAKFINAEQLKGRCKLTVIEMKDWNRNQRGLDTGLLWIPTSPHIPKAETCFYYAATGILGEIGTINNGVGYTLPFELAGEEWINHEVLAKAMNAKFNSIYFRPVTYRPFYGDQKGKICRGVQIMIKDYTNAPLTELPIHIFAQIQKLHPDKDLFKAGSDKIEMFDKVNGSDWTRQMLIKRRSADEITAQWRKDAQAFQEIRKKYLIYK